MIEALNMLLMKRVSCTLCLLIPFSTACVAQQAVAQAGISSSNDYRYRSFLDLPEGPEPRLVGVASSSSGQDGALPSSWGFHTASTAEPITVLGTPKRMLGDQKAIWTSPFHLKVADAKWLLPLGAATGVLIGSDRHTMTSLININDDAQKKAKTLSTGTLAALAAIPAGAYIGGLVSSAPQARETGLLAGEALGDSLIVSEALKFVTRRDRPLVNGAHGDFFSSGVNQSSFPSNHSTAAWAMAAVVGDEYPGWLPRTAVYSLAATVSISRILAEQHFPSDVLVGSAAGWLIGHYVYRRHHNYELTPYNPPPLPESYGKARAATVVPAPATASASL